MVILLYENNIIHMFIMCVIQIFSICFICPLIFSYDVVDHQIWGLRKSLIWKNPPIITVQKTLSPQCSIYQFIIFLVTYSDTNYHLIFVSTSFSLKATEIQSLLRDNTVFIVYNGSNPSFFDRNDRHSRHRSKFFFLLHQRQPSLTHASMYFRLTLKLTSKDEVLQQICVSGKCQEKFLTEIPI